MDFIVEYNNKTKEYEEINCILNHIQDEYSKKLKDIVTDIETVTCIVSFDVIKWDENIVFSNCLNNKQIKMEITDTKWSLFIAMVDYILKKNIDFLCKHRITIHIEADIDKTRLNAKKNIAKNSKQMQTNENESCLNIEPMIPRYSLSQLVLSKETYDEIHYAITLIKKRDLIYKEWGFSEVDPVEKCVISFSGPPGTGKTMAAHAIVKELGLPFLPLNYSDIESKFVGDAPKNLVAAFKKAKETNSVLFFDEADSFLGKRITNISSSSDQAINSLRSQMLILLENYNVITIFATNLKENYDKAFESRILKNIQFQLPNKDLRIQIIDKLIPNKAPVDKPCIDDIFWNTLGDLSEGLAPREIKNLILNTFIKAANCEEQRISCELFIDIFKADKIKRDEIKIKEEEKKQKLSENIKKNIEAENFKIINKFKSTQEVNK